MSFTLMAVEQALASIKVTVAGETPEYIQLVNIQHIYGDLVDLRSVLDAVQTVTVGLDDMTSSGINTGENPEKVTYEVVIATAGVPDDFKWRKKIGQAPFGAYSADIAMTGVPQELENGVFIDFAATTGHTADDAWEFEVKESTANSTEENYPYTKVHRVTLQLLDGSTFYFDLAQETAQAGWTVDAAGLAQALSDINSWMP